MRWDIDMTKLKTDNQATGLCGDPLSQGATDHSGQPEFLHTDGSVFWGDAERADPSGVERTTHRS